MASYSYRCPFCDLRKQVVHKDTESPVVYCSCKRIMVRALAWGKVKITKREDNAQNKAVV